MVKDPFGDDAVEGNKGRPKVLLLTMKRLALLSLLLSLLLLLPTTLSAEEEGETCAGKAEEDGGGEEAGCGCNTNRERKEEDEDEAAVEDEDDDGGDKDKLGSKKKSTGGAEGDGKYISKVRRRRMTVVRKCYYIFPKKISSNFTNECFMFSPLLFQVRTNQMVGISGGAFTMGTDSPVFASDGEGPARRVRVDDFFLDVHEVSNSEFARFVADTGHKTEAEVFGDSFVMESFLSEGVLATITQVTHV